MPQKLILSYKKTSNFFKITGFLFYIYLTQTDSFGVTL